MRVYIAVPRSPPSDDDPPGEDTSTSHSCLLQGGTAQRSERRNSHGRQIHRNVRASSGRDAGTLATRSVLGEDRPLQVRIDVVVVVP